MQREGRVHLAIVAWGYHGQQGLCSCTGLEYDAVPLPG
jgi:hypothetical protein